MADRFPGQIWFRVTKDFTGDINELVGLIVSAIEECDESSAREVGADVDKSIEVYTEDAVREAIRKGMIFDCSKYEASYGQLNVEDDFRKHKIPFDRHSDAKYDHCAEMTYYRPGYEQEYFLSDQGGSDVFVPVKKIRGLLDELDNVEPPADYGQLADKLRDLLPTLPPLEHLETWEGEI